jgi:hypothetical protein
MLSHGETRKLIEEAALRLGGAEQLAERLGIPPRRLNRYMKGQEVNPDPLFLTVVDVIVEQLPVADPLPQTREKAQRLRVELAALRRKNMEDRERAMATVATARTLRAELEELRRRS